MIKTATLFSEVAAIGSAVRRYVRIIAALLRREEESRRREPMESIMNLLEPVAMIATLTFFWWFLGRKSFGILGGNPILFYSTGFFANYFFIYISRRMARSIDSPGRRFPIEQRLDHILVHIILRIADYVFLGVLLFGFIYLFVTPDGMPHDIVPILQACIAIIMLGFGWGTVSFLVSKMFKLWGPIFPIVNRGLVMVSGVIFIPDFLSPGVREIISYNPLAHAIALFRQGFYPRYPTLILDTSYLAWCALVAVVIGLVLERVTRRHEKR